MVSKLKKIINPLETSDELVGGELTNQLIDLLHGVPLDVDEPDLAINTLIRWWTGKFALYDSNHTHVYLFSTEDISSDINKTVLWRDILVGNTDSPVYENQVQTIKRKILGGSGTGEHTTLGGKIDAAGNIIENIDQIWVQDIGDRNVNLLKTTNTNPNTYFDFLKDYNTVNFAALNTATDIKLRIGHSSEIDTYEFWSQADGINTKIFELSKTLFKFAGTLQINNPAKTFTYSILGSAIGADRIITIPIISSDGFLVLNNYPNQFSTQQKITYAFTAGLILSRPDNTQGNGTGIQFMLLNDADPTPAETLYGAIYVTNVLNDATLENAGMSFQLKSGGVMAERMALDHLNRLRIGLSGSGIYFDPVNITGSSKIFTTPNLSGEMQTLNAPQTVSNKTQSARDAGNNFDYLRKYQTLEAYGSVQFKNNDVIGEGHFRDIQYYGSIVFMDNDSSGYYERLISPSVTGGFAGLAHFSGNQASFRREKNGWVICKHQLLSTDYPLSNQRFFFGFYDQQALLPDSDTLLSNTQSGFFIAFRSGVDTNYMILHNDGTGSMQTVDTTQAFPTSSTIHELEIKLDSSGGITWIIRNIGGSILKQGTINTRIPANTTKLFFYYGVQGNGKTILIRNCECKTGGH